eukprot:GGOE01049959.1.p1 GENE.GGOE01049959.1~~GGOE01049959.1.p1  ORF type:complete len:192 (-),score=43.46 GGOE01049959.1:430-1005(-)
MANPERLHVVVHGIIEGAEHHDADNLYCRFAFVHGEGWEIVKYSGQDVALQEGITQLSERSPGPMPLFTFNVPVEVTFSSTSVFGWPQLVVSCYSLSGNKDIIKGYGWVHIPIQRGFHELNIPLFQPTNLNSITEALTTALTRHRHEFQDPSWICQGVGREVTRVTASHGHVTVRLAVSLQNAERYGLSSV